MFRTVIPTSAASCSIVIAAPPSSADPCVRGLTLAIV
jgi:hypothetical protein